MLSSIKISYYQDNTKKYLSDVTVSDTIMTGSIVNRLLSTVNIGSTSADGGTKTYYVEYPTTLDTTDTLYVDYSPPSTNNNCTYLFNRLKVNNQAPVINSSIQLPDPSVLVYIISKP